LSDDAKVTLTEPDFEFIAGLVHETAAILIGPEKIHLVEARLIPVAFKAGCDSLHELVERVRDGAETELRERLVQAMTTNETAFFRDVTPFQALRDHVLPHLIAARAADKTLNVWCAACSTGQEPYTVAMTLREGFPELTDWDVTILATDLSLDVLERAKRGAYTQFEINRGLPAPFLVRYFENIDAEWHIKKDVRDLIDFRPLNLVGDWPPLPRMDIVFLRNVLIYFDAETKRRILGKLKTAMAHDGFLFLGSSETPLTLDEDFKRVKYDRASCYRLAG
jgi:chemotaxis protein methyltransferase CheR